MLLNDFTSLAAALLVVSLSTNAFWVMLNVAPLLTPSRGPEDVFGTDSVLPFEDGPQLSEEDPASAPELQPDEAMRKMMSFLDFPGSDVCGPWHVNYTRMHRQMRQGSIPAKWLTYRPTPTQGLGDNLNGLVTSFVSALVSGRAFTMDDSSLSATVEPAEVDWRVREDVPTRVTTSLRQQIDPSGGSVFLLRRMNNGWAPGLSFQGGLVTYPWTAKEYFELLENATNVVVQTNGGILVRVFAARGSPTYNALHAMGLRMPYALGCIVRYLLKPRKEVLRLLQKPLTALHGSHSSSVCVHLRTTDDLAWSSSSPLHDRRSTQMRAAREVAEAMLTCGKRFADMWLPPSRSFKFLFLSDSQHLARLILTKHPEKIVTSSTKPLHVIHSKEQGWRSALADWLLLSSCDVHIISESGFSKTSSAFNYQTPHRLLIQVRWDMGVKVTKYAITGCHGASPSSLLDFKKWSGL